MPRLIGITLMLGALVACHAPGMAALRPLAPPISFPQDERLQFKGRLHFRGSTFPMFCVMELTGRGIAFAAFTEVGQPIFSFSDTSAGLRFHGGGGLPGIAAEHIVADIQLAYWPVEVLVDTFSSTPWSLEVNGIHRRVRLHGKSATTVARTGDGDLVIHDQITPYLLSLDLIERITR